MRRLNGFAPALGSGWTALTLWIAGFAAASAGQLALRSETSLYLGRCLLIGAILLGGLAAIASRRLDSSDEPPERPGPEQTPVTRWGPPSLIFSALGVLGVGTASFLVWKDGSHSLAFTLWFLGLGSALFGFWLADRSRSKPAQGQGSAAGWILLLILLAALLLRVPNLASIPPDIHGDEAEIGRQARVLLDGGPIFYFGWFDVPGLSFAIPAPLISLFGNDLYGLRAASVLQSLAAILLLYMITKRMFGTRVALLASLFLAIAQWNIHFSRTGSHYMQAQLATLLALYLLLRALDTKKVFYFVATGMAIGLCLNVYYSARLIVLLVPVLLVHRAIINRDFLKTHLRYLVAIPIGFVLFVAPMIPPFLERPAAFMSRTSFVSTLSPAGLEHDRSLLGTNDVSELYAIKTRNTLEAFHLRGETSLQYGERGPLLDFWMGALLPLGVVFMFGLRDWRRLLLAAWIGLTLVSVITTIDAPFGPRMIGLIPPVMVLCALALERLFRILASLNARKMAFAGVALVSVLSVQANYRAYFKSFVNEEMPAGFFTKLGRHIDRTGTEYRYILFNSEFRSIDYVTIDFLVPWADSIDAGAAVLEEPVSDVPPGKGLDLIVDASLENSAEHIDRLREMYPEADERAVSTLGEPLFVSFTVAPEEL